MNGVKETINAHPVFRGMKPEHLSIIASGATKVTFKSDEILFREGEPANEFYLLQSGEVALEAHEPADGTVLLKKLGPGDLLGWSWMFPPFAWHFRARSLKPTNAIVMNGGHLLVTAERNHEFGYELMKRIAQVVIQRLQMTRQQLLKEQIESA